MQRQLGVALFAVMLLVCVDVEARTRSVSARAPLPPLEEEILRRVHLDFGSVDLEPGATHRLKLFKWECCVYVREVRTAVEYSMDPHEGVTLDSSTGVLTLSSTVHPGTRFRVYANLESGRRIVAADVYVETRASNPLRGRWQQVVDVPCAGTPWTPTSFELMRELVFRNDGTFSATWFPFETYKDYWGVYTFGKPADRITLGIKHGNNVPENFRGEGTYWITEDATTRYLHLDGISLGQPGGLATDPPSCGAVFSSPR